MKRLTIAMAVLLLTATSACGAPSNLLIGNWKLDPASNPVCFTPLKFTATTLTQPDPQGKLATIPVTYVAGETQTFPTVVFLVTDAGFANHTTYRFLSRDRMVQDTPLECGYVRA